MKVVQEFIELSAQIGEKEEKLNAEISTLKKAFEEKTRGSCCSNATLMISKRQNCRSKVISINWSANWHMKKVKAGGTGFWSHGK